MRRLTEHVKSAVIVLATLAIYALMQERDEVTKLDEYQRLVRANCLPKYPLDRAITKIDEDWRLHCVVVANAEHGLAPRITHIAALEVPHALHTAPR